MKPCASDSHLVSKLTADNHALQNDLKQARRLAADYRNELCNKSNDFAALKLTFEKTLGELQTLQNQFIDLRKERHRLANEVLRTVALENRVTALTDELNRLRGRPREFIQVDLEDSKSLMIIPEMVESNPARRGRRLA